MKKVPSNPDGITPPQDGWALVDFLDKEENPGPGHLMGTEKWATVYLASTPEQAALMGLSLPGVDTVKFLHNVPLFCVVISFSGYYIVVDPSSFLCCSVLQIR